MSCRDMTINQIKAVDKDFGAKHTISVKGFNDGGRTTTRDLILAIRDEMLEAIHNLDIKLNARIDKLEHRIDNLIKVNNLKE